MIYAVTGGIACGKTTVLNMLKKFGYKVYNTDEISHEIMTRKDVKEEIKNKISDSVFVNGEIDRIKLGKYVFSEHKEKLEVLNSIMHKRIISKIKEIIENDNNEIGFMEVPLLYELNLEKMFSKIFLVYVPRNVQIERLKKRNGFNEFQINDILDKQIDIEIKKEKDNIVIDNTKSEKELEKLLKEYIGELNENK